MKGFVTVCIVVILSVGQVKGVIIDEASLQDAYEDVRDDSTQTSWLVCTYEGKQIKLSATGTDYDEFLDHLKDDIRAYGYVRFETGDEMSRRAKFAFITWIGPSVSPLKKAKVSTDKSFVKKIFQQFGKEILADEKGELRYEKILKILEASSGAAYDTWVGTW